MSNFEEELVADIVRGLSDSTVLAFAVAERVKGNDKVLEAVIAKVDPDKLAVAMAKEISYQLAARARYSGGNLFQLSSKMVMRKAEAKAVEILAQRMADEAKTV